MKFLAAVIELSGEMNRQANEAWQRLEVEQGITFVSEHSPCPHVMLASGIPYSQMKLFVQVLEDVCTRYKNIHLVGNGLGIFVRQTPVLHIRWIVEEKLNSLRKDILKSLGIDKDYNWVAKTSLAYKDSCYNKLYQSLVLLSDLSFSDKLEVSSLALYQYEDGKREIKLKEFNLL